MELNALKQAAQLICGLPQDELVASAKDTAATKKTLLPMHTPGTAQIHVAPADEDAIPVAFAQTPRR